MIVVTGASGHLGRLIVENLLDRLSPENIGVSVRHPNKVEDFLAAGVRVRHGNFSEPDSLAHAFEGATQLLLISSNARAYGGDTLAQHRAAIGAAKKVGAKRIVYTSHMAASLESAFPPMLDHAATETLLKESGLAWTALRNGFYAGSCMTMMGDPVKTSVIATPRDGKVNWTSHADLAQAAAAVLTQPGRFEGPTPPLVSPHSFDQAEAAAIISSLLGRDIERKETSDQQFVERMRERGLPEAAVSIALGFYFASRNGEFASQSTTLEELLSRPAASLRHVLTDELSHTSPSER